ncbi:hypothetical protein ABL78_2815 [Leptomonas seymouri]|uniref:Uncharacterized protein n=1 Tax=Leptomonas seymouri TaxID=5684 RepID=A0A0N1I8R3_LEPSE|nr:hypothetical protein ABL78_2815 [Leptomonas seymouri]|eukprot:KPI88085.1 hypothetical protein ABL78_2815 [Leptomonas seymouri]
MSKHKNGKSDNLKGHRRTHSRRDSKNDGKALPRCRSRSGHENTTGGADSRGQFVNRVPDMNICRTASKSGGSFFRSPRVAESPQNNPKGFRPPNSDAQNLGQQLLPQSNGYSPQCGDVNMQWCVNGQMPGGYGGIASNYGAMMMNGSFRYSPSRSVNGRHAAYTAPLPSLGQIQMNQDVGCDNFSGPQPPLPQQFDRRYPMPSNGAGEVNASGYQPSPPPWADYGQGGQPFHHLPQMPYLMTPNGPVAAPPFSYPYHDPMRYQQMRMMGQYGTPAGVTPSPQHSQSYSAQVARQSSFCVSPQQRQQQAYQQSPQPPLPPPVAAQRSSYSPQASNAPANTNKKGEVSPVAAPASSFNNSTSPTATPTMLPALPRTASILNHVSSFKKSAPAASGPTTGPSKVKDSSHNAPLPPALPPSGGGILNRVSSFKKSTVTPTPSSKTPSTSSAVQAAQTSSTAARTTAAALPAIPQHSAAGVHVPDAATPSIMRRGSFFAKSALAVPEPQLTPKEQEAAKTDKVMQRELERRRLEAEHREREEAREKQREQRRKEMREAQTAASVETRNTTSPQSSVTVPKCKATKASEEALDASLNQTSRDEYSFTDGITMQDDESKSQESPRQNPCAASPNPSLGAEDCKLVACGPSKALNSKNSANTATSATTAAVAASAAPVRGSQPPRQQLSTHQVALAETNIVWHRCPALVLYDIPLRCRRTTNEKGEDVIDDTNFPVRIHGKWLRVTDMEGNAIAEYPHDEFVTHRRGCSKVESKLLEKVRDVVVGGYTASVLSLDVKGLTKPTAAFDSTTWLAKRRLVTSVLNEVASMQAVYDVYGGAGSNHSSIEVFISIALVKKVSASKAAEWGLTSPSKRQRAFETVDLLQPEPAVVPFCMRGSVQFGNRLGNVEYRPVLSEADFNITMVKAQSNANIVLGRLAEIAEVEPESELAKERASVFEVLTCIVRHRKGGAVTLADQLKEEACDVFARGKPEDVISSDDEDDDARILDKFNSHNGPSKYSDMVISCLTCIGVRHNVNLWSAVCEPNEEMAPPSLFSTTFGGPAYTAVLASVDPTKWESVETLSMLNSMTFKLHRRPINGSAKQLIQRSKYQAYAAQKALDGPVQPSSEEQHKLKNSICRSTEVLNSLQKVLAAGG